MKQILQTAVAATALAMLLVMGAARAQQAPDAAAGTVAERESENEGEGDDTMGWIAATVTDIDRYGTRYRQPFVDEIVRYHGAPRALVVELLDTGGWAPADVYYACTLAQLVGRPCRFVANRWPGARAGGWDAFAAGLGVEPGSAQFDRLQQGLADSYRRWGRPLRVEEAPPAEEGAAQDD